MSPRRGSCVLDMSGVPGVPGVPVPRIASGVFSLLRCLRQLAGYIEKTPVGIVLTGVFYEVMTVGSY